MLETPVRVLQVLTVPFKQNGITRCVMNYVSRFEATRVRCDLVAPNAPDEESAKLIERTGGQVFVLRHRNADPLSYIHQLSLIVSERNEQIVHAHGNSATLAFEMMAAKLGGAKIRIPHSHNTTCKMKLADKALRGLFRHSYTDAMACGEAAGEWLFEEKPFTVLHNAIAAEHFHFDANKRAFARGEYGIPEDAFAVCHVGTFNEQKNQRFLIEAFALLLKSKPESVKQRPLPWFVVGCFRRTYRSGRVCAPVAARRPPADARRGAVCGASLRCFGLGDARIRADEFGFVLRNRPR